MTNQDAGGVNILVEYTPSGSDPQLINFLQAYDVRINGGAPVIGMDNGRAGAVPFYNATGVSGTDSNDRNVVPLDATNTEAWMLDVPYVCESGSTGTGMGCPPTTPQNDDTVRTYNDYFQTWIEATGNYDGVNYNVLYGGFSWGFDFSATDVPEPSTWAMLAIGFAGLGFVGYRGNAEAPRRYADGMIVLRRRLRRALAFGLTLRRRAG